MAFINRALVAGSRRVATAVRAPLGTSGPVLRSAALLHSSAISLQSKALSDASEAVKTLKEAPDNQVKLKLYALFKQASVGPNKTPKPGMFDVVGKFKHDAWSSLGDMSQAEAEKQYVALVDSLLKAQGAASAASAAASSGSGATLSAPDAPVLVQDEGKVRYITLNRPSKRNAITFRMYHDIVDALEQAAKDEGVRVVVLTGAGSFYSSGNDLSNFAEAATNPKKVADEGEATLKRFVGSFIHFPKMLVVGLNGPAVGITVTTLPLADLVYASNKATLHAPLTALGQTPEGCGSITYPLVMGNAKANELMLAGKKITAEEAKVSYNLVNDVYEDGEFKAKLKERALELAALPPQALMMGKNIMRERLRPQLDAANAAECALIKGRWLSQECQSAIAAFMSRSR